MSNRYHWLRRAPLTCYRVKIPRGALVAIGIALYFVYCVCFCISLIIDLDSKPLA